jgi:hypothetical protein
VIISLIPSSVFSSGKMTLRIEASFLNKLVFYCVHRALNVQGGLYMTGTSAACLHTNMTGTSAACLHTNMTGTSAACLHTNMTGTSAACLHTNQSRSYLNHLVYLGLENCVGLHLAKCETAAYFMILLIGGKQIPAVIHGKPVIPKLI